MGHRKHSQPRRGSLAYLPRCRAQSMEARIRTWPRDVSDEPHLLGHAGFKAGCVQIVSIDDREKTANFGKQLVSLGTVIATPPLFMIGVRGYSKDNNGRHAEFDVYSSDIPKSITKYLSFQNGENALDKAKLLLSRISEIYALVTITPSDVGLDQKKPYVFEVAVSGGDIVKQFEYVENLLGKPITLSDVFEHGSRVDVGAITKGKGWQGVIKRYGAKKKQHKSRKTVRELGSLGPISPQYVMYTVPRAGQMGFHQRVEYNKRIMVVGNAENDKMVINPTGGYKHFGNVTGDFIILKGSVPGTYRRLVKLRAQARNIPAKITKPNVLEVVV